MDTKEFVRIVGNAIELLNDDAITEDEFWRMILADPIVACQLKNILRTQYVEYASPR